MSTFFHALLNFKRQLFFFFDDQNKPKLFSRVSVDSLDKCFN